MNFLTNIMSEEKMAIVFQAGTLFLVANVVFFLLSIWFAKIFISDISGKKVSYGQTLLRVLLTQAVVTLLLGLIIFGVIYVSGKSIVLAIALGMIGMIIIRLMSIQILSSLTGGRKRALRFILWNTGLWSLFGVVSWLVMGAFAAPKIIENVQNMMSQMSMMGSENAPSPDADATQEKTNNSQKKLLAVQNIQNALRSYVTQNNGAHPMGIMQKNELIKTLSGYVKSTDYEMFDDRSSYIKNGTITGVEGLVYVGERDHYYMIAPKGSDVATYDINKAGPQDGRIYQKVNNKLPSSQPLGTGENKAENSGDDDAFAMLEDAMQIKSNLSEAEIIKNIKNTESPEKITKTIESIITKKARITSNTSNLFSCIKKVHIATKNNQKIAIITNHTPQNTLRYGAEMIWVRNGKKNIKPIQIERNKELQTQLPAFFARLGYGDVHIDYNTQTIKSKKTCGNITYTYTQPNSVTGSINIQMLETGDFMKNGEKIMTETKTGAVSGI